MSRGFELGASGIRVWDGARTVFSTAIGRLLNFLPVQQTYSFSAIFPDADKGRISMWSYLSQFAILVTPPYFWVSWGIAAVGARGQEWSQTIDLGPAPPGANIFIGRARVIRTKAPSHSWVGEPLAAPAFNDIWVPVNGSMLMEQGLGICRAMSIFITGGRLVAYLQHSVSPNCGGYRQWGDQLVRSSQTCSGGENRWDGAGTAPALPVYFPTSSPGRKVSSGTTPNYSAGSDSVASNYRRHRWDGPDAPVYSDPTDYSSIYSVELVGRFGRHA